MEDKELDGKLVYLTIHFENWLKQVNPAFNVPMANRLAKVVKVFDWDTEEGRVLLAEREKTGKWTNLNPKDFKFVLKVYYPELVLKGKLRGFSAQELACRYYPGKEITMFEPLPDALVKELVKEEKNILKVEKRNVSGSVRKKSK